jgi:hypothetical protein
LRGLPGQPRRASPAAYSSSSGFHPSRPMKFFVKPAEGRQGLRQPLQDRRRNPSARQSKVPALPFILLPRTEHSGCHAPDPGSPGASPVRAASAWFRPRDGRPGPGHFFGQDGGCRKVAPTMFPPVKYMQRNGILRQQRKKGPVGFCPAECVNFRCLDHRNEGTASTFFFGQQNCPVFPGHSYPARYADKSRQEIHLLKKRKPGIIRTSSFLTPNRND